MKVATFLSLLTAAAATAAASPASPDNGFLVDLEIRSQLSSRLANVHVAHRVPHGVHEPYTVTYGECHVTQSMLSHHTVGAVDGSNVSRLAWVLPENIASSGCLSAWSKIDGRLIGRSETLHVDKGHRQWLKQRRLDRRDSIKMDNSSGIDAEGPWFDGVAALQAAEVSAVDAAAAKAKKIAIVGAGMGGLMSWLCLNMSGFSNIEIVEAGYRLGGRVHTAYLEGGPFDYQYQEMGPMRFPEFIQYAGTNESLPVNDMQLVFQLAGIMNEMNGNDLNYTVGFIPWIQTDPNVLLYENGIKKPNGMTPTMAETENNTSLVAPDMNSVGAQEITSIQNNTSCNPKVMAAAAINSYKAHKAWLDTNVNGTTGDEWSEFAYYHNKLGYSLNDTWEAVPTEETLWSAIYDCTYFSAVEWKTIDGGLNRLPYSFYPHVGPLTTMNRSIERAEYLPETNQVRLGWKNNYTDAEYESATYDYAMISAPFTKVRNWRFPNTELDPVISNAIQNMPYTAVCKVALQFSTRFWEHYPQPIFGGCSETDIPGIGTFCYPSYNLNASGPGVLLASYSSGDAGLRFASLPELEHVQYVLNAMAEIHGQIAHDQYTGKYNRRCWVLDPLESASWASPSVGQHKLYIPSYFKTHGNMIFVGEHTAYTHAWIASALESAVRGSVQLLLGLGLVDEAKNVTERFMGRWISV